MDNKQEKFGIVLSYILVGVSVFSGMIFTPFLINKLGKSQYGLYELIGSITGYMYVLNFGLGSTTIKFVAEARARNNKEQESSVLAFVMRIYSVMSIIVIVIGTVLFFSLKFILSNSVQPNEMTQARLMLVLSVLNMAISIPGGLFNSYLIGCREYIFARGIIIVENITRMVVLWGVYSFTTTDATALTSINLILTIIVITINVLYSKIKLKIEIKLYKNNLERLKREILEFSIWSFLMTIIDQVYWRIDTTIIGIKMSTSDVAVYSAGSKISSLYQQLSTAISGVFLPAVTHKIVNNNSDDELLDFMIKVGRIQGMALLFVFVPYTILGRDFMDLWLGEGFSYAWATSVMVMGGLLLPLMMNSGIAILQAKNKYDVFVKCQITLAFINIILTWNIVDSYGMLGAAFMTMITHFGGSVVFISFYYHKYMMLNMKRFYVDIFGIFPPAIVSGLLLFLIRSFVEINNWLVFFLTCVFFALIYASIEWIFALTVYEKSLFSSVIDKVLMKGK